MQSDVADFCKKKSVFRRLGIHAHHFTLCSHMSDYFSDTDVDVALTYTMEFCVVRFLTDDCIFYALLKTSINMICKTLWIDYMGLGAISAPV